MAGMAEIVYPISCLSELKVTLADVIQESPSMNMSEINTDENDLSIPCHGKGMDLFALSSSPKEKGLENNDIKDPKVRTVL